MTSRTRSNPDPTAGRRRGISLLEMILVLAVLVAAAALVLPALQGPMDDQRLLKSADLIRAQWTKARVAAMKSGKIYVFRYTIASDAYVVEPWYGEVDVLEVSPDDAVEVPMTTRVVPDETKSHPLGISGLRLPDGIMFFTGETAMDTRTAEVSQDMSSGTTAVDSQPPIVFYPDGSTSDARVVLTNERFYVEVSLRGLTGMVRVSELRSSEELSLGGGLMN
jgi:Tfp pilus assembly protein FimT